MPVLKEGSSEAEVIKLQEKLKQLGFNPGIYGWRFWARYQGCSTGLSEE
jgi:hypothetical protein